MAGCCVICYQRDCGSTFSDENEVCTKEKMKTFFKMLQRYLNGETQNEGLSSISGDSEHLALFLIDHAVSSGMSMCGNCLQIMDSFSELYHELKTTELKLSGKLWSLKILMESASKYLTDDWLRESGSKLNIDRSYWSSGEEMLEMLTDLKGSLIKKCCRKIEIGLPKVVVPKLISGMKTTMPQSQTVTLTDCGEKTLEVADTKRNIQTKQEVFDINNEEPEMNIQHPGDDNTSEIGFGYDVDESISIPITGTDTGTTAIDQNNDSSSQEDNLKNREGVSSATEESNIDIAIACLSEPVEMHDKVLGSQNETEENKNTQIMEQSNFTVSVSRRSLRAIHHCQNCKRIFSTKLALANHQESCRKDSPDNLLIDDNAEEDDDDDDGPLSGSSDSDSGEESPLDCNDNDISLSDGDHGDNNLDKEITTKAEIYTSSTTSSNFQNVTRKIIQQREYKQKYVLKCPDCTSLFLKLSELLVHHQQSHPTAVQDTNEAVTVTTIRVEILVSPATSPYPESIGIELFPHYSTIEVSDEVFICPMDSCKLACYCKKLLEEHSSLHGEFKCHSCDVVFSFAPDLALHELTHEPRNIKWKTTQKFCCRQCDFKCAQEMVYIRHFLKNHLLIFSPPGGVECAICKCPNVAIGGLDKNTIFVHYKKYHDIDDARKLMCNVPNCPSYFSCVNQKRAHQQTYHGTPTINTWKCFKCSEIFDSNSKLIEHANVHYEDANTEMDIKEADKYLFKCSECNELFRYLHELLLHRENEHLPPQIPNLNMEAISPSTRSGKIEVDAVDGNDKEKILFRIEVSDKVFICSVDNCNERFYKTVDLEHHKKYSHGNFKCEFCETVKSSAVDLAKHEIEHAPSETVDCARCKIHFTDKKKFIYHHLMSHIKMDVVNYNCPICSWSSNYKRKYTPILKRDILYKHLQHNHDIYNCDEDSIRRCTFVDCDAYFVRSGLLDSHRRSWHKLGGKDLFGCHLCDKRFKKRQYLAKHRVKQHAAELILRYKCPHSNCGKSFEDKYCLHVHIRTIHGPRSKLSKDFKCQNCDKCFAEKRYLDHHIKVQTCRYRFVCTQCGKAFKQKISLQMHELIHAGPQSWEHCCHICGKRFAQLGGLKMHMGVHSNDKPFVCQVCGVKYAHRHNLRIHINNKHGDSMQDKPKKYDLTNYNRKKKSAGEGSSAIAKLKDKSMKVSRRARNTEKEEVTSSDTTDGT